MTKCEEGKALMKECQDFLSALKCPKAQELSKRIEDMFSDLNK